MSEQKKFTAQEMRKLADDFGADACGETGEMVGRGATGLQPVTDCNRLGNAAEMRKALNETQSVIEKCMEILNRTPDGVEYDGLIDEVADELCDLRESHVNAALSAPPRNCDRPECATTRAAQEVWRKEDGGKTAYYEWLLATSKCHAIAGKEETHER